MVNKMLMRNLLLKTNFIVVAIISTTNFSPPTFGDDWPGLLGTNRDGLATGHSISSPNASPKLRWSLPAGEGYAGAAIANQKAVLYDRLGNQDRIRYVNLSDGKLVWETVVPSNYSGGIDSDHGPRCVPSIVGDRIVLYSAAGDLTVLSAIDGKTRWNRAMHREFEAGDGYFGAGSTPIVYDKKIIVNVGGKKGGVVAVNLEDGQNIWTATTYDASYASPILVPASISQESAAERSPRVVVVPTRLMTVGLNFETGSMLWEFPFGQRGPTVNGATPLASNDTIFLTASYGIGHASIELTAGGTAIKQSNTGELLSSQYATPVWIDGNVYGSDGREDQGGVAFRCIDPKSDRILWEQSELPICHTFSVGQGQILLVGIDGSLRWIKASPYSYLEIARSQLAEGTFRAIPALADGNLLMRSTNESTWYCFQLNSL